MTRQRYPIVESINRILRLFQGETVDEQPGALPPILLSENEAWSDLAELLNSSLPSETLTLPTAFSTAITNAGFASGTASSIRLVTGTSTVLVGATTFVIGNGLSLSVTGTFAYLNTA